MVSNIKSLEHPDADLQLAKDELSNSPLYVNLLLNLDANTTALQINLPIDEAYQGLIKTRQALIDRSLTQELSTKDQLALENLSA